MTENQKHRIRDEVQVLKVGDKAQREKELEAETKRQSFRDRDSEVATERRSTKVETQR